MGHLLPRAVTIHTALAIIAGFLIVSHVTFADDSSSDVTIDPPKLLTPTGSDEQTVTCSFGGTGNVTSITWFDKNAIEIMRNTTERYYQNDDGVLTLTDHVEVEDTGNYTCVVIYDDYDVNVTFTGQSQNNTIVINIYVMPTYFKEGMIVLGINVGLAIIFFACFINSAIADKKRLKEYGKIHH